MSVGHNIDYEFLELLDSAIESHLSWTQRILRCSVLHVSPGEDVLLEKFSLNMHFR